MSFRAFLTQTRCATRAPTHLFTSRLYSCTYPLSQPSLRDPPSEEPLSHSSSFYHRDASLSPKSDLTISRLAESVASNSADQARFLFQTMVAGADSVSPAARPPLHREDRETMTSAICLLARSRDPNDLALIESLLGVLHGHWSSFDGPSLHYAVVQSLCQSRQLATIGNWLVTMPNKPGACTPSVDHWHLFFWRCRNDMNWKRILSSFVDMRRQGCPPNRTSYQILFDTMVRRHTRFPRFSQLEVIVKEMVHIDGVPFTHAMFGALVELYNKAGSPAIVAKLTRLYDGSNSIPPGNAVVVSSSQVERHKILASAAAEHRPHAVQMLDAYIDAGFQPTRGTLAALTETVVKVSDVVFWEKKLGIQADAPIWETVIRNASENKEHHHHALETYRTVGHRGIPKTAAMFHPLLRTTCTVTNHAPSEKTIDQALEYLKDYLRDSNEEEHKKSLQIYNVLLRTLTKSDNVQKHLPVAVSLVEDMQSRHIPMDDKTITSIIIALMHLSRKPGEALELYRKFSRKTDGTYALRPRGCEAILNVFCNLTSFSDGPIASGHYFDILQDMRQSGYPVSVRVYTILLHRYATLATRLAPNDFLSRERLVSAIRRTHNVITIDGSVAPDIALWNQLMDTYQRAGCFEDTYNLWQTMFVTGQFDNISISIIIDCCAFSGADEKAVEIYTKLHTNGFKFNLRNWNNWLECLCRLGKLDLALKMLCLEMAQQKAAQPDADSVSILLKFAIRTNQQAEVKSRVKRYLPELWDQLPNSIRQEPI